LNPTTTHTIGAVTTRWWRWRREPWRHWGRESRSTVRRPSTPKWRRCGWVVLTRRRESSDRPTRGTGQKGVARPSKPELGGTTGGDPRRKSRQL